MADRVEVIEPVTGATVTVSEGSVQARLWQVAKPKPAPRKPKVDKK